MVRFKAFQLITDEGFSIYSQTFGATKADQDMVGSLLMALSSFAQEALGEGTMKKVDFGEGADMILEEGIRIKAVAVVVLDKDNKERDELNIRKELLYFIKKIEKIYSEELDDPIFQKSSFSGVGTLISNHFFRDKMSRIYHQQFASLNEYLKYPKTLLFKITSNGPRIYSFYREFPKFEEMIGDILKEEFDKLIFNMQDMYSMISFKDCLELFGEEKGGQILELFKFLTQKGMFEAFNFERLA